MAVNILPENSINNFGYFLRTTVSLDVARIADVKVNSEEFKELLVRLYQAVNDIELAVNAKHTGRYLPNQFVNGKQWILNNDFNNPRQVYSVYVNCGALPSTGTNTIAHGIPNINSLYTFVNIYGTASDQTGLEYIPLPYSSATDITYNLEVSVDATSVYITTGGNDYSAFNASYIVLEFIQF